MPKSSSLAFATSLLAAALAVAAPGANAQLTTFRYVYSGDEGGGAGNDTPTRIYDYDPGTSTAGVASRADYSDIRRSQLPTGPNGDLEFLELTDADTQSSTVPGVTVGADADASSTPSPGPFTSPARASTGFFASRAFVASPRNLDFASSTDPDVYLENHTSGTASSSWHDTWTATSDGIATLGFGVDGQLRATLPCDPLLCGVIFPQGTDSVESALTFAKVRASVTILDLDTLVPCEEQYFDLCDGDTNSYERLMVAWQAQFQVNDPIDSPVFIDPPEAFTVPLQAGHRYFTVSSLEVEAQDGSTVDFFNTFALESLDAPNGLINSAAAAQFGAVLPSPVPAPGAEWLGLAAIGALVIRARGRRASS